MLSQKRVFVKGLGFITPVGNSRSEVTRSVREGLSGIALHPEFDVPQCATRLAGMVKGFEFPSRNPEDWSYPAEYQIEMKHLRPMSTAALYGYCASMQAVAEAGWSKEILADWRTGLVCASAGSAWQMYFNIKDIVERGPQRAHPLGVVRSIAGSLNFNLGAALGCRGGTVGFSTACASSAHAIGYAADQIRLGRWDRALVVGAEEVGFFTTLPFVAMRALSSGKDPAKFPRPFDKARDGFVGAGGATALTLEGASERPDGACAEVEGWGESSDGFSVMAPEPEGAGLAESMRRALADAGVTADQIDYINAHGTGTTVGDSAELRAIKAVFGSTARFPQVSSTKSITGHGLSLAGAMEAGFCCLALQHQFIPPNTKLDEPDPESQGVPLPTKPQEAKLEHVMSNSSGFGGSNVCLVLRKS